ncbi:acyltransferase family protein [Paenibacillus sp. CAU 1782]
MSSSSSGDLKAGIKKFRPELEGVRAVAAMLVAVYHIWVGSVSGGVDVFFIVSGYLITTSLLSKMEKEGHIRFFEYLLGLGKRLFPNAFIILLFVTLASFFVLPQVQWRQIISEVFSSASYFQNWNLALDAVDYLAQHNEASPLQHFWALSIQGQFYVVWPLVIYTSFIMAVKWLKTPPRKTLLAVLLTIFAASITYSIYITSINQPWAYFDTFARVWEFSLGGIVALLLPYVTLRKPIGTTLGWIGLCIIALTGIILPVSTVFPGYAALLPISGVMFIIISAENSSGFGVVRLLGSKPFLFFGSISYAFYLWHWPLLLFYLVYFRKDDVSIPAGISILLLTFVLSLFTTRIVESPIRNLSIRQSNTKLVFLLAAFALPVILANLSWSMYADRSQEQAAVQSVFQQQSDDEGDPASSSLSASLADIQTMPTFYKDVCYVGMKSSGMKMCSYGETNNPDFIIALVGGSRAGHWFPALEQFAEESKLRIDVYNKDACRFTTDDFGGRLSDTCMEWNELAAEAMLENPPDVLMTTANVDREDSIPDGYVDMWKKFEGITTIFAVRDTPSMPKDVPSCVEMYSGDDCSVPRDEVLSADLPWANTEGLPDNVYFADMTDYLCDDQTCQAVIDNVVVYRDKFHLSTQFAATLAEPLKEELFRVIETIRSFN